MLNREYYLKNIADCLNNLRCEVTVRNTINLYDINIVSETFYAGFLNIVEGWKLINANCTNKNAPGVDLIDETNRISIQVTSDNSSDKIKHTIEKFISSHLYEKYDRLIVLVLTGKRRYTTQFDDRGLFRFDKDRDIWDTADLISKVNVLDTEQLEKVNDFVDREFTQKYRIVQKTEASEVETIMDLIEFISSNKKVSFDKRDFIIDPEYKIYRRFKEFADSLITQYETLLAVYGTALSEVKTVLGSDDAQDIITMLYLQDLSMKYLAEADNDPVKALDALVDFFGQKLGTNGKRYDSRAIKFYLINEMIKCSVFPNERGCE